MTFVAKEQFAHRHSSVVGNVFRCHICSSSCLWNSFCVLPHGGGPVIYPLCHDNGGLFFSAFYPFILISFLWGSLSSISHFSTFKSCDHSNIWSLPIVPQTSNSSESFWSLTFYYFFFTFYAYTCTIAKVLTIAYIYLFLSRHLFWS